MISEPQKKAKKKYRKKLNAVTVQFYPKEKDIWEKLEKQENKSGYIKELIRKDGE